MPADFSRAAPPPAGGLRAGWIMDPVRDTLLALAWVPFVVAAMVAGGDTADLQRLLAAAFVISTLHQPLTLPLVYADRDQRTRHPSLYRWAPLAMVAVVVVGLHVSLLAVAVIGGLWNVAHTLQQRYGIARIYGRKAENHEGRYDRALLWSLLGLAVVSVAALGRIRHEVDRVGLDDRNRAGVLLLADLQPVARLLVPLALAAAAYACWAWVRVERRQPLSAARLVYLGSTVLLLGTLVVSPIAGFIAYVGSHAVEYFVVVHHRLQRAPSASGGSPLARAVSGRVGPLGALALFTVAMTGAFSVLGARGQTAYLTVVLTVGGLHILYDGFIWKLRTPELSRTFHLVDGALASS